MQPQLNVYDLYCAHLAVLKDALEGVECGLHRKLHNREMIDSASRNCDLALRLLRAGTADLLEPVMLKSQLEGDSK